MKIRKLRTLSLVLCVILFFSMFPVTAEAASNPYSTLSSKKVLLTFPKTLLSEPLHAKVSGEQKKGGIYYVPKPETGNGDLGIVKKGTNVTIFAEEDGYYFFMTNSGRMGWNKVKYFTEPEPYDDYELPGDSGLTTDHLDKVMDFLKDNSKAGGSSKFYPTKSVVIVKKGKSAKFTVYARYSKYFSARWDCWENYCKVKWASTSIRNGKAAVSVIGKDVGSDIIEFTNSYTDKSFNVLVLVV